LNIKETGETVRVDQRQFIRKAGHWAGCFYIISGFLILLSLGSCGKAEQPSLEKEVFLISKNGSLASVKVGGKTGLFAVASWCHYSWQFIDTLNDPKLAEYTQDAKLIFALKDEVESEDDVREIRESGGKNILYDEAMLAALPGEYYFITPESKEKSDLHSEAYPRWFNPATNRFEKNVILWFRDQLAVPEELFYKVYTSHKRPPIKRL